MGEYHWEIGVSLIAAVNIESVRSSGRTEFLPKKSRNVNEASKA